MESNCERGSHRVRTHAYDTHTHTLRTFLREVCVLKIASDEKRVTERKALSSRIGVVVN